MATFERMGNAILTTVTRSELFPVQLWGRYSAAQLRNANPLMWNGRFEALSGDPFDNSAGFKFPEPEGTEKFPANDPIVTHLLIAQAHIPPTELVEVAGFTGTSGTIGAEFDQFDDGLGASVPPPDASGCRNEPIRQVVLTRLNGSPAYQALFAASFPSVAAVGPIDFTMFARAVTEFEFTLVFAN